MIHDLAVSDKAFNRDFEKHYARFIETSEELATIDIEKWVAFLKLRHDHGQTLRAQSS